MEDLTSFTFSSLLKLHNNDSKGLQTQVHTDTQTDTHTHRVREKKGAREIQVEMVEEKERGKE